MIAWSIRHRFVQVVNRMRGFFGVYQPLRVPAPVTSDGPQAHRYAFRSGIRSLSKRAIISFSISFRFFSRRSMT